MVKEEIEAIFLGESLERVKLKIFVQVVHHMLAALLVLSSEVYLCIKKEHIIMGIIYDIYIYIYIYTYNIDR